MNVEEELRQARKRWRENLDSTIQFNATEAKLFQWFKREHPDTWETEWPEIQRRARL